jgi:hypothetical protein
VLRRSIEPSQYTAEQFHRFCKDNLTRTSLGRTGVCWDNAAAESFFAALKNEMYYRQTFPSRTRARFAVAEYIEVFYNRRRLHSTLGYRTPFEALTEHRHAATAALLRWLVPGPASQTGLMIRSNIASCAPVGYRFPREVIAVAVRWYLRYALSYRDVEELLAERGVEVDHVTA